MCVCVCVRTEWGYLARASVDSSRKGRKGMMIMTGEDKDCQRREGNEKEEWEDGKWEMGKRKKRGGEKDSHLI